MDILKLAQSEALNVMKLDPNLEKREHQRIRKQIQKMFENLGDDLTLN